MILNPPERPEMTSDALRSMFLFFSLLPTISIAQSDSASFQPIISPAQELKMQQEQARPGYRSPILGPLISSAKLQKLEKKALAGSPDAANRLSTYYDYSVLNTQKRDYWVQIAAENGSAVAQGNYGMHFPLQKEEQNKRSVFWLEKSRSNGFAGADRHLFERSSADLFDKFFEQNSQQMMCEYVNQCQAPNYTKKPK